MNQILIGTSGYDYPEWKGLFYPSDLKRADFLSYYSSVFNALELNNTFYNMPTAERMLSFWQRSQGRLSFSVKANRLLTHEVGRDWQQVAEDFMAANSPLLEKNALASILFQFPQSFHYSPENRIYLAKLIEAFKPYPLVIEFRHKDWVKKSVFEGLEERGAAIAFCDMPELKYLPANMLKEASNTGSSGPSNTQNSPFYVRLHGRNAASWYSTGNSPNGSARYVYDYSDEELQQFVPVIISALEGGKRPVVFFNNHPNGSGAKNAVRLKSFLSTP